MKITKENLALAFPQESENVIQCVFDLIMSRPRLIAIARKHREQDLQINSTDPIVIMLDLWERKKTWENEVELMLECLNQVLQTCGVEYIEDVEDTQQERMGISYLNTGHTYASTIVYDWRQSTTKLTDWGSIVEDNPKRFSNEG